MYVIPKKFRKISEETEQEIIRMYTDLWSPYEIRKKLGVSVYETQMVLKKHNIPQVPNSTLNATHRRCTMCKEKKERSMFKVMCVRGVKQEQARCLECFTKRSREYNKERYERYKKPDKIAHFKNRLRANFRRRERENIGFKIKNRLRNRMHEVVRRKKGPKTAASSILIGCSPSELRKYLESKFQTNMSWDNYGLMGWHIDHIIPCAAFDLTDPEQQRKCFHYTNLQPLWREDNIKKGDKLDYQIPTAGLLPAP